MAAEGVEPEARRAPVVDSDNYRRAHEHVLEHGLPGFSPTQGHIASAIPFLGHALDGLREGPLRRVLLLAKGSLFLGRMTQMADGLSVLLERNDS